MQNAYKETGASSLQDELDRYDNADWLTLHELADRLHVREGHLRSLVARAEIPYGRVGRLLRFHWPSVEKWVKENARQQAMAPRPGPTRES